MIWRLSIAITVAAGCFSACTSVKAQSAEDYRKDPSRLMPRTVEGRAREPMQPPGEPKKLPLTYTYQNGDPRNCPETVVIDADSSDNRVVGCLSVEEAVKLNAGLNCGTALGRREMAAGARYAIRSAKLFDNKNYCLQLIETVSKENLSYIVLPVYLQYCGITYESFQDSLELSGTGGWRRSETPHVMERRPDKLGFSAICEKKATSDRDTSGGVSAPTPTIPIPRLDAESATSDGVDKRLPTARGGKSKARSAPGSETAGYPPARGRNDSNPTARVDPTCNSKSGSGANFTVCQISKSKIESIYCDGWRYNFDYYLAPKKNDAASNLPIFEKNGGGYYISNKLIANPYSRTAVPFLPALSVAREGFRIGSKVPEGHLIKAKLPSDVEPPDGFVDLSFTLRVVASRRALDRAGLQAVHDVLMNRRANLQLNIIWDEIGEGGELQPAVTLTSLADLAKEGNPQAMGDADDIFTKAMRQMRRRITLPANDFDRLIIIKEKWQVTLAAAQELFEFITYFKANDKYSRRDWISAYSESTATFGNDYFKTTLGREWAGTLTEESSGMTSLIPESDFATKIVDGAKWRYQRDSKAAVKQPDEIIIAAAEAARATGYIFPLAEVPATLGALSASPRSDNADAARPAVESAVTVAQIIAERVKGLQVPKNLTAFHEDISYSEPKKSDRIIAGVAKVIAKSAEAGKKQNCTYMFLADNELFSIPSIPDDNPAGADHRPPRR